ncbi:formyltetrahydrofolate deformylase [Halomarina pelagica]|uniref:formyltetrahydrofolate deformylase n=1 Tax=Halomarina pelagica TaxID=2961599 RepID=UPI0020C3B8B5|nr:formyltetrahydrofolate deformylase [Halomarina sp. BND7]
MTSDLTEVTVIGSDKKGIIARVTTLLFERGVNVEDLDQAVQDGVFRMTLHVDTSDMVVKPETLREALHDLGEELGQEIRVRFPSDRETRRIAVLVTKESHCLEALIAARDAGEIDAELSVVVGNHDDLAPVAEAADIPFYDVGDGAGVPDEEWLIDVLDEHDVDLVVLARYMRILGPNVVFRYEGRIINVHPSLLPAFPGAEAYRQAREEGVRIAGVTAHYVTTDLDQGPVVAQRAFDVPDGATVEELEARGQPLEAEALVEAVKLHLDGALAVYHGRTHLREEADGDYQLGLPEEAQAANPETPVDANKRDREGEGATAGVEAGSDDD